jgi:shikimate kinase
LDEEIERRSGRSINDIFQREGEGFFRDLENATFARIRAEADGRRVIVALGAGFSGEIPPEYRRVWVRRQTDADPRVFFDRPRLDTTSSAAREYLDRWRVRDVRYRETCDEEWFLPEAPRLTTDDAAAIVGATERSSSWVMTLDPRLARQPDKLTDTVARGERSGIRFFELRDDLLNDAEMATACAHVPREKTLLSLRRNPHKRPRWQAAEVDWPLEFGPPPVEATICSLHEREPAETFQQAARRLQTRGRGHLKLAVEVRNFAELRQGFDWWRENPLGRSFLPRSPDGRWRWYRQLIGDGQKLQFVRWTGDAYPDQPTLWQMVGAGPATAFAAVLGDPVEHSWSPWRHREFFRRRNMPFLAIPVAREDAEEAVSVLLDMGLVAAAFTSPHKPIAYRLATEHTPLSERTRSANTWRRFGERIEAHNTDLVALEALLGRGDLPAPIAVWGGGGLLPTLKACCPEAHFFSARTGQPRDGSTFCLPGSVIWASGPVGARALPADWRPRVILDLQYTLSSPARQWAVALGVPYRDGGEMFELQARAQQEFWTHLRL